MKNTKTQISNHANAGKHIRKELKQHFPHIKFKVRSESYSMGSSINVSWTNGVTEEQVENIIKKYQYGHFNGMIDLYEHSNSRDDIPQVKFVFAKRELSKDNILKFAQVISEENDQLEKPQTEEDLGKSFDYQGRWFNWYQIVWRYTNKLDLSEAITIKHKENYSGSVDECYEVVKEQQKEQPFFSKIPEEKQQEIKEEVQKTLNFIEREEERMQEEKIRDYKEKQERKIKYYEEKADKLKKESKETYERSHNMISGIPPGQPILVGHHSEKRHRKLLDKSWNTLGKSIEISKKAEYYENKAQATRNNTTISSDDPEAIKKLKEKLQKRKEYQEHMKKINKSHRAYLKDPSSLQKQDLTEKEKKAIIEYKPRYSYEKSPYQTWQLSNNNANIKRIEKRIEQLEKQRNQKTTTIKYGEVEIIDNVEDNRIQVFFPSIPEEEIRTKLKRNGFRWSRYNKCWQSYRGKRYLSFLKDLLFVEKEEKEQDFDYDTKKSIDMFDFMITMKEHDDLVKYSEDNNLKKITVEDLIKVVPRLG